MPVPAERRPRRLRLRERWSRHRDRRGTLRVARRVADDLAHGLAGTTIENAARGMRHILEVDAVGLADLSGSVRWSGGLLAQESADSLVADVLHTETRSGRPPLVAMPLHVRDELVGVLVVVGQVHLSDVRESARWVMHALERARLEASAEQAARSELRALRAEISPHFMYNALTVIAAQVRSDQERCRELMLDFAEFIRYGLARNREYTTVSDEFHAIETYLALQRAVLGDRLRVQIRVAPEVLGVYIPYLVLQPLVENAVRHGIEPSLGAGSDEAGLVQVQGEAEGNDLIISIDDNGVGMDPAEAEAILAGHGTTDSVGLTNVDRRLRTVYGAWFGLTVETAEGSGTRAVVRVPMFQPGVVA